MVNISEFKLPEWVIWIAMDEDGVWWGYEVEPLQYDRGWYENEVGKRYRIGKYPDHRDWRETLLCRR